MYAMVMMHGPKILLRMQPTVHKRSCQSSASIEFECHQRVEMKTLAVAVMIPSKRIVGLWPNGSETRTRHVIVDGQVY